MLARCSWLLLLAFPLISLAGKVEEEYNYDEYYYDSPNDKDRDSGKCN
jgi:hypothetical protein